MVSIRFSREKKSTKKNCCWMTWKGVQILKLISMYEQRKSGIYYFDDSNGILLEW